MQDELAVFRLTVMESRYPRYDPAHGTPDPMVRRVATILAHGGRAQFEQTDYGHPGRFNPWSPRTIDVRLLPHTEAMRQLCESITQLL